MALNAAVICLGIGVLTGTAEDRFPEICGDELKARPQQSADRYQCIEVTERCLLECRGGIDSGTAPGRVSPALGGTIARENGIQSRPSLA